MSKSPKIKRLAADRAILETSIWIYLAEIRQRLDEVAGIARAAEACAAAGRVDEAVYIAMRFEPITYEADRLLSAVTILNRRLKELRHVKSQDQSEA